MRSVHRFIYSCVFVTSVALLSASSAFATHYRGGTISWVPTGTPGQVEFRIKWAQRYSAGVVTNLGISFGDGQSGNATGTVTSVNTAEDWYIADLTVRHTYTGVGPYTASFSGCCRISELSNGHDENLFLMTTVRPASGNSSPVSGLPAIVSVARGTTSGFVVPASDVDRDTLRFRLATVAESGVDQPPGLSINSQTGQVSWNTQSRPIGSLWTTQIMIEDLDAAGQAKSRIPIDVILKIVQTSGVPPVLTLTPPGPISLRPGTPVTFQVTATDADPNARVSIGSSGLPSGSTMTPAPGNLLAPPVTSTFTWIPTPAQTGSFQVTFTATDDTFLQALRSITIFVEANQPPAFDSCVAPVTTAATGPAGAFVQFDTKVSDPNGDAMTVDMIVDGVTSQSQHVNASPAATSVSLAQTFAIGVHTVVLRVADDKDATASCETSVQITKAEQTISFDVIPALTYGSPAVSLAATASSELPVDFAVLSGPASLSGSTLTVNGAGTVVVRASQAGDDTYMVAAAVDQAFTVAPAVLTIVADDVTRQYGSPNPISSGHITGVVTGDPIAATYSSAADASSPVGTYAIVPALQDPSGKLTNYHVTVVNGTLTVTKAALTVQANDAARLYGEGNPELTGTLSGIVNGDAITATYSTPAGPSSAVGHYAITPTVHDAAGRLGNYDVTTIGGTLAVNRRPLLIQALDASKVYGAPLPAFGVSYDGFVANDSPSALAGVLTFATPATADAAVGTYAVTPGGVTSGNYDITFRPGVLTITYNVCTAYDTPKAVRIGSTLPIKLRVCSASGANASSPEVTVTASSLSRISSSASASVEDSGNANPDGNFRFTLLDGAAGYIFNLSTKGLTQGTYELTFHASGDPMPHTVQFQAR